MSGPEVPPEGLQLDLPLEVEEAARTDAERLVAGFLARPPSPPTDEAQLSALLEVAGVTLGLFALLERLAARRIH